MGFPCRQSKLGLQPTNFETQKNKMDRNLLIIGWGLNFRVRMILKTTIGFHTLSLPRTLIILRRFSKLIWTTEVFFGWFEKYKKLLIFPNIGKNVQALETYCGEQIDFARLASDFRANCDKINTLRLKKSLVPSLKTNPQTFNVVV